MTYSAVVHNAEEGGFWEEVPALPGCYSEGESIEESLRNVREAMELYLEVLGMRAAVRRWILKSCTR